MQNVRRRIAPRSISLAILGAAALLGACTEGPPLAPEATPPLIAGAFSAADVEDEGPTALAQDITVQLDASGHVSITAEDVDDGSTAASGIASLAVSQNSFGCADVGGNTVTLTVTDVNGNSSTADATVTVEDNVAPVTLARDITIQLDASGAASITPAHVDGGSSDACGIASQSVSPSAFGVANVGDNVVTLTNTDVNGNRSTAEATVTVQDTDAPTALAKDITIQLDGNGATSITAEQIDNGSSDAAGIASLAVSRSSFGCLDVGLNTVTLTVTDVNGNSSTAQATVTVEDNVAPTTLARDITVDLDASGAAFITPADVDRGSSDACGIASQSVSANAFGPGNFGANLVTLTNTDVNGNVSSAQATVTVRDVTPPQLTLPPTNATDESGNYVELVADGAGCTAFYSELATAWDGVDPAPQVTSSVPLPAHLPLGTTLISYTATDFSGNSASAALRIVVLAPAAVEVSPSIINKKANGKYVTVYIESAGGCFDPADIDVSTVTLQAVDPVTSIKLSVASGTPTEVGDGNNNGVIDRMVKFDRATVQAWFPGGGTAEFLVEGKLLDGRRFEGTDGRVTIID